MSRFPSAIAMDSVPDYKGFAILSLLGELKSNCMDFMTDFDWFDRGEVVVYKTTLSAGYDFICEEIVYLTKDGRQCPQNQATFIVLVWDKASN